MEGEHRLPLPSITRPVSIIRTEGERRREADSRGPGGRGTRRSRPCLGSTAPVGRNPAGRPARSVLSTTFDDGYCPPGTEALSGCVRFVGTAEVPGLGRATDVDLRRRSCRRTTRTVRWCSSTPRRSRLPARERSSVGETRPELRADCARVRRAVEHPRGSGAPACTPAPRGGRLFTRPSARWTARAHVEKAPTPRRARWPARQGRHAAYYMRAEVRKAYPYRQDARHVCRDRQQRERWERKVHRHRQAGGRPPRPRAEHPSETGVFDAQRQASRPRWSGCRSGPGVGC